MHSHFSVILLCLSGVYGISSTFDNIKWEDLKQIINGQSSIKEWETAMEQDLIYKHGNDSQGFYKVKEAVNDYAEIVRADDSALNTFETLRDIIKTAYQCTLAKYASLATFLLLQDFWQIRSRTLYTLDFVKQHPSSRWVGPEKRDIMYRGYFHKFSHGKYHLDYDVNVEEEPFQLFTKHDLSTRKSQEIHNILAAMIGKTLGVNIKHNIYPDVIKATFRNQYRRERIDLLNKFICVLNESIILLDNFIVDKCVQHEGNFVKNFESLKTGLDGDLMWLLAQFDELKDRRAVRLYHDFTNPIPPNDSPVKASGCFVKNLEINVAGYKWDLPNTTNPTAIYGQTANRQSETKYKIVETAKEPQSEVSIAMVSIRDPRTTDIDHPQPRTMGPVDDFPGILDTHHSFPGTTSTEQPSSSRG
ncbi:uncharacterized protein LOC126837519 [Adelges cooleyi]|uniref:uncharacterized protein LOC126837519 n=1 Tax=Adelges cooleyi TaxID=133065 RepID=UPI00217F4DE2|nr:uncharacterized protein LOC126837519 [Adelges cooleyi]